VQDVVPSKFLGSRILVAPDLQVAHPTDAGGSSNSSSSSAGITQDTGADAKATTDTNAENK
jgi:hypothetical protein